MGQTVPRDDLVVNGANNDEHTLITNDDDDDDESTRKLKSLEIRKPLDFT